MASAVIELLAEGEPAIRKSKDDLNREKNTAGVAAVSGKDISPLFEHNHTDEPVFLPGNMLDAARIQKKLPPLIVPEGCLLDFDGELVDFLVANGKVKLEPARPLFPYPTLPQACQ